MMFNAIAYVDSPRVAYIVRSRVLYEVLGRLAQAGLQISASSTVVLRGDAALPLAEPQPPLAEPRQSLAGPQQ